MTCYVMYDDKRNAVGHMCGELGKHCADCQDVGDNLCDYPVGKGKTCDRSICEHHSHEVAPNMHYCDQHYTEWREFRDSGGVKAELENVVPFRGV
jgi:3-deoxy-D-manno-octulosonate 8-phosphate phosphatase KdsC-like HAD superfamily phosphatase